MRVSQAVLEVLDRAEVDGPALRLVGQIDRKLYTDTNKALELAGGKWNRGAKAHLFPIDAADAIEPILLTGEITDARKEFQAFYTPEGLAAAVVAKAKIGPGMKVLEPSAGEGALARYARDAGGAVTCVEIHPTLCTVLGETCATDVVCADFLTTRPSDFMDWPFDRVVMNPPFSRQQDARHVLHAATLLKPGGRLVAIVSDSVTFRDTPLYRDVRDLVHCHGGTIEPLPDGSFKASGTSVNTVLVSFDLGCA